MRYIPDNNLSYPILITLNDGSRGSGFHLNYHDTSLYIVTARHVLYNNTKKLPTDPDNYVLKTNRIRVLSYTEDLNNIAPSIYEIDLTTLQPQALLVSNNHDIAVIKIADLVIQPGTAIRTANFSPAFNSIQAQPGPLVTVMDSYFKNFNDVLISNEVIIFGYPVSLGSGIEPERPLLRKGIIAGKNLTNRTIILDCPVYQGNSGGLAIEVVHNGLQRISHAIGVVASFVPFIEVFQSLHFGYKNQSFENSGYSIITPIDVIFDLIGTQSP